VVVLDNLWPHKRAEIRQLIESAGCRLLSLPHYSPEFDPIEPCRSKKKNYLRALEARALERLEDGVAETMNAVAPADATGWFKHCGYGKLHSHAHNAQSFCVVPRCRSTHELEQEPHEPTRIRGQRRIFETTSGQERKWRAA
jgi:hypothetical protein